MIRNTQTLNGYVVYLMKIAMEQTLKCSYFSLKKFLFNISCLSRYVCSCNIVEGTKASLMQHLQGLHCLFKCA